MMQAADTSPVRARPAATEPSAIVILKEAELGCDVATAIRRIRAQEGTKRSRILVIAPETTAPEPPEAEAGVALCPPPPSFADAARRGELEALAHLGRRTLGYLTCMERFFEETRWALDEIEEAVGEEPRARLLNQIRVLKEIQGWTQAVADDLRLEVKGAVSGFRAVETAELWQAVLGELQATLPEVRFSLVPTELPTVCWGRTAELAEAFGLALLLTAKRSGARGVVTLEARQTERWLIWQLKGMDEPTPVQAPEIVARLRLLITEVHGGKLEAGAAGPDGTVLELYLPLRRPDESPEAAR